LTQRAELRQLQAQINPHFLYNSFFILYRMAKDEDYDNITTFLKYLAEYYRFITRDVQSEVPLASEVAHAHNYTEIQLMRFSRRISASFAELPERYRDMLVPRLILQPVIENAFEHGLKDVAEHGELIVEFIERDGTLLIGVEDNGTCLTDGDLDAMRSKLETGSEPFESTGIINIHRRLRLKFGEKSGLLLSRGNFGGLRVELKLEMKGQEADV
jgi:two-component system, sensor histidine kinase YesM